jgi:hypothetical protein
MVLATALSGWLSGYFMLARNDLFLDFGPGLLFGIATAAVLFVFYKTSLLNALLWVVASTVSWYAALHLAMNNPDPAQIITPSSMTMAGGIGAFILCVSYSLLVAKIGQTKFIITVLSGSLLGTIMYFVLLSQGGQINHLLYIISFVLWQVGVGLALTLERTTTAPAELTKKEKVSNKKVIKKTK